jgi:site-specific recombinase XerC
LQLDRTDWNCERVIVRGKGDAERTAVITQLARAAVERYLAARTDDAALLFLSYSNARARPAPQRPGCRGGMRSARRRAPDAGDLREVLRKATFAGRWVSHAEQLGTVFALFGITV